MQRFFWQLNYVIVAAARQHPLRLLIQLLAIAIGVALGLAVHLINESALGEFASAVRQINGEADAVVRGPREGFSEQVFAQVALDPMVQLASPVLELEAAIVEPARLRGQSLALHGIDALRAARLSSNLIGEVTAAEQKNNRSALLGDGLYLSPAALQNFDLSSGDSIGVQVSGRVQTLKIIGRLPAAPAQQVIATMDLGFAQWRFDLLGRLSRIDLQLAAGADLQTLAQRLALPAGVALQTPDAATARASNLSRAYRVNLNVLALVALFTGAFLVYSLQSQAVLVRRPQLAFLRVLGATIFEVEKLLLAEALVLGAIGALLGVVAAFAIAAIALQVLGGDLGGGYFSGVTPRLAIRPQAVVVFFFLGVAAAVVGSWIPARSAGRTAPALALKTGSSAALETAPKRSNAAGIGGLVLVVLCLLLLEAPPVFGMPLAAYLAIAMLLVAAIVFKPWLAPWLFSPLARLANNTATPWWLATWRLAATPRFASTGAAGIVASFALMVAMATMVASFRQSVDDWLGRVLPADVYLRAAAQGSSNAISTASLSAQDQRVLSEHPAVAKAEFSRVVQMVLDPARAPVALIARPLQPSTASQQLPLTGNSLRWSPGMLPPIWVSEAITELYEAGVGDSLSLPLAGQLRAFVVAGVWRDYARQTGAIVMDAALYEQITHDRQRSEASLWLKPGADASAVMQDLSQRLETRSAQLTQTSTLRQLSLQIFDRSFAVTYVLEIVAIFIGLTGIAATFSAQAVARAREFGMLRHLGVSQKQILLMLAAEGLLVTLLAILLGLLAGLAVAWVLIHVVNPQSFYWTMDMHLPSILISSLVIALLVAASLTAVLAGRRATSTQAVLAVREDW